MTQPFRILFICHGNICRSPMAEFVMKELVRKAGAQERFDVASAATSTEEIGNDVYPPARRVMDKYGVHWQHRRARQVTAADLEAYDVLIVMDANNDRNMFRRFSSPRQREVLEQKMRLLMEYAGKSCDVADPWYTGDFDRTYRDVLAGCQGLLAALL